MTYTYPRPKPLCTQERLAKWHKGIFCVCTLLKMAEALGRRLREAIYFETVKLVTVRNLKLGIIHKSLQLLVIVYVAVFAIWYKAGTLCTILDNTAHGLQDTKATRKLMG